MYYVYNIINQVWIVMIGKNWQIPQSFRIRRTPPLISRFLTGHLIDWGNVGSRVRLRSIPRSNRVTICNLTRSEIWLAENMGLQNLTETKFGYVRPRHSPAVLMRVTCQGRMHQRRHWYTYLFTMLYYYYMCLAKQPCSRNIGSPSLGSHFDRWIDGWMDGWMDGRTYLMTEKTNVQMQPQHETYQRDNAISNTLFLLPTSRTLISVLCSTILVDLN